MEELLGLFNTIEQRDNVHDNQFYAVSLVGVNILLRFDEIVKLKMEACLLYTSPSPRDKRQSRMPSSA